MIARISKLRGNELNDSDKILDIRIDMNSSVIYQDLGGELVLLNTDNGAYYGLNELGAKIWVLLKEEWSMKQICDSLFSQYEVTREHLAADVEKFINTLIGDGLANIK